MRWTMPSRSSVTIDTKTVTLSSIWSMREPAASRIQPIFSFVASAMPVVVVEDEASDAQRRRRGGGHGHRRHGGELVVEVIRHEERRVAELLDLLRLRDPVFAGCALRCLDAEAEVARHASLSRYRGS